jgi:nicotinamidase-related amidase
MPANARLLLIDPQEKMMPAINGAQSVLARIQFLAEVADHLEIRVLATAQNRGKLGDLVQDFHRYSVLDKMTFSAYPVLAPHLAGVSEVFVVGVESHICIYQTVIDCLDQGIRVTIAGDACGARTSDRHELGMAACQSAGATILHSEGIAYQWLGSAEHPKFRDVLAVVKHHSVPI